MWSRLLLTGAILAGLVYAMVLGVNWLTPQIESDIADRVTTKLAEQGMLWAEPSVVGRAVVISGTAPTEDARTQAITVVKGVFGVAEVSDALVVADPSATVAPTGKSAAKGKSTPYQLLIEKQGDQVTLSGQVPDDASLALLQRVAVTHYGAEHVNTSGLVVAEGAPAGWRTAAGAMVMHIANLETAKVQLSQTEVMVGGEVLSPEFAEQMEAQVRAVLPTAYKVAFAVEVVTPTAPQVVVAEVSETVAETSTATVAAAPTTPSTTAKISTSLPSLADVAPAAGPTCAVADLQPKLAAHRVQFAFDKAEVRADQRPTLTKVTKLIKPCAGTPVVVAGYTDVTGSPLYNRWLSEQRAQAALRGLLRQGVTRSQLTAVGYGEGNPVASNTTREGRAANRRVEFHADALPLSAGTQAQATTAPAPAPSTTIAKPWWAQVGALLDATSATTTSPTQN